ncbi:hypothetical protein QT970_09545 [Microcoleus sp. herbarium8]
MAAGWQRLSWNRIARGNPELKWIFWGIELEDVSGFQVVYPGQEEG